MTLDLSLDIEARAGAAWMLGSFVVVFLATRVIVRLIRAGKGPFRNQSVGGVHLHHLVHGIFLMLLAGVGEFTYQPDPPWLYVLAAAFGAGAALTLDEFALWLHLSDVYWEREGRVSVDAVLVVDPGRILAEGPQGAADLYVALTRATQRLGVLHREPLPAVLRGLTAVSAARVGR